MIKPTSNIAILLLAAGAASRMRGGDKLLEQVGSQPLLRRLVAEALHTGLSTYVTLPAADHPRARHTGTAQQIIVPDWQDGMSASIRAGIAALPAETDGAMILPSDMPELESSDLLNLAAAFKGPEGPIFRACDPALRPGHPVLFPRRCFTALKQLSGDQGAKPVLQGAQVELVPLPDGRALVDLDTPEAWAAWRAARR